MIDYYSRGVAVHEIALNHGIRQQIFHSQAINHPIQKKTNTYAVYFFLLCATKYIWGFKYTRHWCYSQKCLRKLNFIQMYLSYMKCRQGHFLNNNYPWDIITLQLDQSAESCTRHYMQTYIYCRLGRCQNTSTRQIQMLEG